jgi:RNA polymerase sigma-70 factor (ECF subfamily)
MELHLMADEGTARHAEAAPATDLARDEMLRWFDELRDPLWRYLLCSGASAVDADEAVQESFLKLYQHLEKRGDQTNLRGWVFQVARNYVRDEQKSARRRCTVPLDDAMEHEGRFADPRESPEHCAMGEEQTRRLHAAIAKLGPQQQECILLRSAGLRYREIADVMGINISSVGTLVQRAVARLSEELR